MKHRARVNRYILIDILSGSCGALVVGGLLQRSWLFAGVGLLLGVALLMLERDTIEQEETPTEPKTPGLKIPSDVVDFLEKRSKETLSKGAPESKESYAAGLQDGTVVLAQYILDELKEESE